MFIMGISTYISLKKYNFTYSHATLRKILRRTVVIFIIGMAIGWFSRFCYYWSSAPDDLSFGQNLWASVWTFDRMRILGAHSGRHAAPGSVLLRCFHRGSYDEA